MSGPTSTEPGSSSKASGQWNSCAATGAASVSPRATSSGSLDIRILLLLALGAGIGQRAVARRAHELGILPDRARAVLGLARRPALLAAGEFLVGDVDRDLAGRRIEGDDVAVLDVGDRAADGGLGADVADAEAAGGAREAAVGDERDLVAHALAVERGGGREHLAHAGAALGALVADDEHVAFLVARACRRTRSTPPRCRRRAPGRRSAEFFMPGDLHDRAVGREVAAQRDDAAGRRDRVGGRDG